MQSLTLLAKAGSIGLHRVPVLRSASNFDMPPPGLAATENLARTKLGSYSAYLPALDAAWRVGNAIVVEFVRGWSKHGDSLPDASQRATGKN